MLNTLRHLLPDSTAWRLVVERTLKKYLRGVATVGSDTVEFVDDVYDDLWPDLTRELDEWLDQFGIDYWPWANDDDMRAYLDFRWGEDRSTSPKALQDKLQAAGFDAYVYDSFDLSDVSLSTYTGDSFSLPAGETNPHGFCFGNGGRKLYFAGDIGNAIYEYTLTGPYDLSAPSFVDSHSVAGQDGSPFDVKIGGDGTKMFVLGAGNDAIYEYDLPTQWSVVGAQYVDNMSVTTKESVPQSFAWKPDGTEVYVTGTGSDDVHQYTLGTAWDISTGTFTRTYDPLVADPTSITFSSDGTRMYLVRLTPTLIHQWDLGTAWDISTASNSNLELDMVSEDSDPFQVLVEGTRLFMLGIGSNDIYRYRLGAWRDPLTYADQPKSGTVQCGDDGSAQNPVAECGEEPDDQKSLDSAVCNNFLANEVWYLVNDTLTQDAPPHIPTDSALWGPFWYVGGTPIGTELEVDEYDRQRFEKLCLKHGPAEAWVVTIIDIWSTTLISSWVYEADDETLDTGEWQFTTTTTTPVKISDRDSPVPPNVPDADIDTYAYRTGITGADQEIRFNHVSDPTLVTTCWLGESDQSSTSHGTEIEAMAIGDWIRFTKTDGEYMEVQLTGTPADNTTFYIINVANGRATSGFTFPADDTNGNVKLFPSTLAMTTNQGTALSGIASGDKLRFEVSSDGTWIEYVTTGAASDQTSYWSIAINTTATGQSSDWAGFPSAGGIMKIYHRESV